MNHCLLEVKVKEVPVIRYTQDNQTPIAEMQVLFRGLRSDDPPGLITAVGWGTLAQELQSRIQAEQELVLEGRLRMNTIQREDGTKEKKAEFTISKLHFFPNLESSNNKSDLSPSPGNHQNITTPSTNSTVNTPKNSPTNDDKNFSWDSSPLIPDNDEIPF